MSDAKAIEAESFKKYLATRKILIADESASARSGVFGVLTSLGAKPTQITLSSSITDAEQEMAKVKPDIVIAEFNFGKYCGLDLLQRQREKNPDSKKTIFILLTGNTSQSAVARAAEEDVDAFVLKPFTPEVFRNTLLRAATLKINPPEYLVKIESGKAKLLSSDLDGAREDFVAALKLDPAPALAHYYLGLVAFMQKAGPKARTSFEDGLGFNKIHYKCLVGLYDLYMEQKMVVDAYQVVKKISQYFPANPKRLAEILRLAIQTQSYEDVEKYYSMFCNIDERNDTLVNYICAALVVCGKHYLKSNNRNRALELFQKAVVTSAGRLRFIKEIVQTLIDSRLAGEAAKMLERYPPEAQKTPEYLYLDFQILDLTASAIAVLNRGRDLIRIGVETDRVYEIMLHRAIESKNARMSESLLNTCQAKFPAVHANFLKDVEALKKETVPV